MTDEKESGASPVPPDQEPGEPSETVEGDEAGQEIAESEAEAEEDRVDAAPREIT